MKRLRALLAHARAGHRIGCETCARRPNVSIRTEMHLPEPRLEYDAEHDEWTASDDVARVVAAGETYEEARSAFHAALLARFTARSPVDAARRDGRL